MVLTTTIFNKNSYDYWWLMIDTRVKNQLARWNYFITVGT